MTDAQIELYPERELTDEERVAMLTEAAPPPEVKWGWRKVVLIPDNPERWQDTGTIFDHRQEAYDDAAASNPGWAIG